MATRRYDISRVRRITGEGIYYVDHDGKGCFIDFAVCRRNFQAEHRDSSVRYVGYRDFSADRPYFTFSTDPPTKFEFPPFCTPPLRTVSWDQDPEDVCEWNPEAERQWQMFSMELAQVDAATVDLA